LTRDGDDNIVDVQKQEVDGQAGSGSGLANEGWRMKAGDRPAINSRCNDVATSIFVRDDTRTIEGKSPLPLKLVIINLP